MAFVLLLLWSGTNDTVVGIMQPSMMLRRAMLMTVRAVNSLAVAYNDNVNLRYVRWTGMISFCGDNFRSAWRRVCG